MYTLIKFVFMDSKFVFAYISLKFVSDIAHFIKPYRDPVQL